MTTKTLVAFLLLTLGVRSAFAQNDDCEVTISRALEEYNAGHFYAIPSVLEPCLNQFTTEQRQRAYLLLTQTYLLMDDPIGAKQSYLSVLRANPEFLPDTAVHTIDVIYLSKKFTATSIFSWFAKAGTNVSQIRVIHDLKTVGETTSTEKYDLRFGYQAAVGGDLAITEKINARAELGFLQATYKHTAKNFFVFDSKQFIDRQSWVTLPLSAVYSDHLGKYRPYGYVGYSFHYLIADRGDITVTNNRPAGSSGEELVASEERENTPEESPQISMLYKRNRLNQSVFAGGGLKIKMGLDFIFVDVRYSMGLRNVVSEKNLYADYSEASNEYMYSANHISSMDPSTRYMHVDDFFRLDNISFSIGFLRPLYKPRELKRARTKSVMKQLKD
jgi:hypothetical protein